MLGTAPSFFKIPVTEELSHNVAHGENPTAPTIVTGYIPNMPRPKHRIYEGMKPLDNRHVILQCFEAFKKFVV